MAVFPGHSVKYHLAIPFGFGMLKLFLYQAQSRHDPYAMHAILPPFLPKSL